MKKRQPNKLSLESFESVRISKTTSLKGKGGGDNGGGLTKPPMTGKSCKLIIK